MPKRPKVETGDCRGTPCPFCGGTGVGEPLPKVDTVETWARFLEALEVDERARMDWCTLYSTPDPRGKQEALSIVHKFLKKDSGGYGVDKPSAFIVATVRNAWHYVRDDYSRGGQRRGTR